MSDNKSSWDYEKARNCKQIRIVFNLDDPEEAQAYHFLERYANKSGFIKHLIYEDCVRCAHEQA